MSALDADARPAILKAGLSVGDLLEAKLDRGKITLTPKSVVDRHFAAPASDVMLPRSEGFASELELSWVPDNT